MRHSCLGEIQCQVVTLVRQENLPLLKSRLKLITHPVKNSKVIKKYLVYKLLESIYINGSREPKENSGIQ